MKKTFCLFIIIFICFSVSFITEELGDFYPGRLNICFSASGIRSNVGGIEIQIENGIVQTQFDWFNEISIDFEITQMRQLFKVRNSDWNREGRYLMNMFNIMIADHSRTSELREVLEAMPDILFAEYDPVLRSFYTPNDPMLSSQYAIRVIEAELAWHFETGSRDIIIGVVDSGVKWNHPDLVANIWTNEEAFPGITIDWSTGEIIGGNGTEVIIGWDFANGNDPDWWNLPEGNNPFQTHPGNQHGTHVSGCAAAVGDNGIGVVGPAFTSRIMATKHSYTSASTRSIFFGYEGIIFCVENGANIVNTSWGGGGGAQVANEVISFAKDHGVLVVSSAGNNNNENLSYPAAARDAFSVAATDHQDLKASFSTFGTHVDISAPGVSILSTYYDDTKNDNYASASGTSMSAPVLAGVAALIWSYYPELTVDELKDRLRKGADPIDHLNQPQFHGKLGVGRVNAFNSLMFDRIPRVEFDSIEQINISGDDNTLNPGETLSFKVLLKNRENWLDGIPTTATIYTENPFTQIINPTVSYGTIPQGEVGTSENSFIISVDDDIPIETNIEFIIKYNANGGTGITYEYEIPFTILVSRNKDNRPLNTRTSSIISSIVFDLTQDGQNEIIFLDSINTLHVKNSINEYIEGFPVNIPFRVPNPLY